VFLKVFRGISLPGQNIDKSLANLLNSLSKRLQQLMWQLVQLQTTSKGVEGFLERAWCHRSEVGGRGRGLPFNFYYALVCTSYFIMMPKTLKLRVVKLVMMITPSRRTW